MLGLVCEDKRDGNGRSHRKQLVGMWWVCDDNGGGNGLAHGEQSVMWGWIVTTNVTGAVDPWGTLGCMGWVVEDSGVGIGLTNGEQSAGLMRTTATGRFSPRGTFGCEGVGVGCFGVKGAERARGVVDNGMCGCQMHLKCERVGPHGFFGL